jgi:agmatinase
VPFDQAVTHRTGTRFGPRAIREASSLQPYDPPYGWPTNPLDEMSVIDYGDCAFDYAKVSDFPETLTAHIRTILAAGAGTITLGGDHYITFPILKAYAEKFGPLGVIHFDAHSDLWPDDDLSRIDHGTMLYKAVKTGIVDPKRSVQIGIRTTTEDYLGVHVIDAREVHEKGVRGGGGEGQGHRRRQGDLCDLRYRRARSLRLCARHRHAGLGRAAQLAGGGDAARSGGDQHGRR